MFFLYVNLKLNQRVCLGEKKNVKRINKSYKRCVIAKSTRLCIFLIRASSFPHWLYCDVARGFITQLCVPSPHVCFVTPVIAITPEDGQLCNRFPAPLCG